MTTIRIVLSIVVAEELHLEQLDVKNAFLHGHIDEDIYIVQLEGFQIAGKENVVCKLIKSLYGLKQAPRQWYLKFDNFMSGIVIQGVQWIIFVTLNSLTHRTVSVGALEAIHCSFKLLCQLFIQ